MTRELSLLKCSRADKINLLECEKVQKETVPDGHEQGGHTDQWFQALGLGLEFPAREQRGVLALRDLQVSLPVNGDGLV